MSVKTEFTEAMMSVAQEAVDLWDEGHDAETGPNPPVPFGEERVSSNAVWQNDWAKKTQFQRQMEIDQQGQQNILNHMPGYAGGNGIGY